jgi:hypothetical protein
VGPITTLYALLPLEFFARGGGGGSGGSSGGGGEGIFFVLGYLPMHFVGSGLAKLAQKFPSPIILIVVNIVGWAIAIAYAIIWTFVWKSLGFLVGIAALVGVAAGLYGWFGKIKQSPLVKKALAGAAAKDAAWDEDKLLTYAKNTFIQYQKDWSVFNTDNMKAYLTDRYLMHAWLLMTILHQMGRRNAVSNVSIAEAQIVTLHDSDMNDQDQFTVGFTASAHDELIETATDKVLFTDNNTFTEYWTFKRNGNNWLLDTIGQSTADAYATNSAMQQLASRYGYYYSQDMGWLFIPKRGVLFEGARFGTSDINNHIVGMYDGKLLVQVYSYIKDPQNYSKPYVVAQAALPKSYGQIVVRRKKSGLQLFNKPRGLEKVETEWTEFNKKYEVYADNFELATSFELLNPTYMEQLEALPFEVNIEVVDNVVYLYVVESRSSAQIYQTMLDLLQKAFKEMRL